MSVSFTWKPENPNKGISFASGSNLNAIFENAFGRLPVTLTEKEIPILQGISYSGNPDVEELIAAILNNGSVVLEAHW